MEKCRLPDCKVAIQACILRVDGILTNRLVAEKRFLRPRLSPPMYMWCPQTMEPSRQMAPMLITI